MTGLACSLATALADGQKVQTEVQIKAEATDGTTETVYVAVGRLSSSLHLGGRSPANARWNGARPCSGSFCRSHDHDHVLYLGRKV